jgi:hypothetical protein
MGSRIRGLRGERHPVCGRPPPTWRRTTSRSGA